MTYANEPTPDVHFRNTPRVDVELTDFRLSWAIDGFPIALDPAAATMLDFFNDPLQPSELERDLVDALDLDLSEARRSVTGVVSALVESGHLWPADEPKPPVTRSWYPLSASP